MAKRRVVAASSEDAVEDARSGLWLVKLDETSCKAAVVEADSELEAIEKYKEVMGIRNSIHPFKCGFLEDGADHLDLDEHGIVVQERAIAEDES